MTNAPFSLDPDDSQDIVDKVNKEFKESQEPESNLPDRPTIGNSTMDKLKKLSDDLGVSQIREDVDVLKSHMSQIVESQQQVIASMNKIGTALNKQQQGQPQAATAPQQATPQSLNPENMQAVVSIVDTLADVWKKVKGEAAPVTSPIISQDEINKKMAEAFYDNLETGESITRFIKDSLKKTATKQIVGESLKNIGGPQRHEPE